MKKILCFAGSNSSVSINKKLITYTARLFENNVAEILDLTNYSLPVYSEDIEKNEGFPEDLKKLKSVLDTYDALVISVNEHNGSISVFFKNILDWLSRLEYKFFQDKKILLLSTSPGKRGGATALEYTKNILPRYGAEVVGDFAFPSFQENFSVTDSKIVNPELKIAFQDVVTNFTELL